MKNPRRVLLMIIVLTFLAVGFSLPEGYPLKINLGKFQIDQVLNPLAIDLNIGSLKIQKKPKTVLGLDLAGGARIVYEADVENIPSEDRKTALDAARNVIERRVNLFGVAEPVVQTSKVGSSERIIVELPGVTDVEAAKTLIGKTAQLDFREFESEDATASAGFFPTTEMTKETGLTGKDLKKAGVTFNQNSGQPEVALEFTAEGAKLFEEITKRNVGKNLPVFLDEMPVTNPTVNQVISGGNAVISGSFTQEEAKSLAIQLNSGALPVPIKPIEEKTVGPTLGRESVEKSIKAGFIGLTIVMAFMFLYYGKLGLLADIALFVYGVLSLAIFRLIPITMTLPGVAGFILSIGMAVDANILIFERIKEEQREGKPWKIAMELGFGRAWDSIRDANFTTLLTTFILFNPLNWSFLPQFGMIRGFAATLAIGIFVSLFTGIVVSRNLIRVFIRKK
ncbi:MAG: Preprotein translocase subunit SecD [Candidatus Levybacteria bacterium GW2011_GWA2_40_8]|nr:MAG: Preprotein translocase subunit SecD [Candidatus Levybacteria bacterium GW2011_GWA2_40_8]